MHDEANPMKILDVDLFQDGIQRNITMLDRLSSEMEAIHHAVNGLVQMEDQLKGAGGNAIRSFYQECHLPFLHFFQLFSEQFKQVLNQMEASLHSLEPDSSGYILETFLDGELEQGLTLIGELTASLTDEANSIMNQVSDIVALPHLDDSGVQEGVISSKRKRDDTLMQLYEFDALQTFALNPIEHGLQTMDTWLTDLEGLFTDGVTDIDFRSNQWAAISMNSELKTAIEQQTSRVNGGLESSNQENLIGTEITPGTFRVLEGKKTKTIHRGAYGSFNLLKFHLYENGLIIKEYQLGTSKPIQYVVVNEVEEEFEDGGVRELDGYFEGTKLAFVDYLRPHAIVKKGFKLAFISGAKISKYKGDLSVRKTPTVENKSKGSVNGSKEAGNPNKGTDNPKTRLPRTNGKWEGEPGNGKWNSDKPEVRSVTNGKGVEFIDGRPNFSPWSKGSIKFKEGMLDGSKNDFNLVYEKIIQLKGFKSQNQAKFWLKEKGLTPHHKSSTEIELIPTDLHGNIPHIGSASDLRGGKSK
ncbi:T7SS effector LXG polymorphic toxin [Psychrobacillus psychrodurans]|uniref:T7SS effector LXG polymorphic toxin n=1 Tax=Psychrobacillus psychrodurans TaxID=126157 RepID=UPI001F4EEE5C|nr:T7SS effector LXG polymorphic toxin [Psychrobacillus psychrodurans]MCK1998491.1 T7SS effector LXG polymorphic toxin [Psychrobacillus psychrodurans]